MLQKDQVAWVSERAHTFHHTCAEAEALRLPVSVWEAESLQRETIWPPCVSPTYVPYVPILERTILTNS